MKNQKLFIIIGGLLLVVGVSLAYFVTKILTNGNGGGTSGTTAVIRGAKIDVEGILEFEDLEILPEHKTISTIKVTATGNNKLIPYNLIWKGTNTLSTKLNFTIYKTSKECTISNIDNLGNTIATGTINKNESKVTLVKDEFVTATSTGEKVYYYVILEYPNLDEPQNYDLEGSIEGKVTVEESDIKPDINILATYVKQEDGEYKQVEAIPQEGYQLNAEKSTCSNGTIPRWDVKTKRFYADNLNKSGTSCYLYFDEYIPTITIDNIIASVNPKDTTPNFSQIATTDEGVYKVADGMYGGYSYYWRGAVTDNYVKFGGFCWRIVRINGDGSMRLIYDGVTCHANGTKTTESIAVDKVAYNTNFNQSNYVGWTYEETSQRTLSGTSSNAKTQTEKWYNANITGTNANKVADGKYCNDRNPAPGYKWAINPNNVICYAAYTRLWEDFAPTLACNSEDVYTLKVGLITTDEILMAGGRSDNASYYLYNGQKYWTMSPCAWIGTTGVGGIAGVFFLNASGFTNNAGTHNDTIGLRPVINLKADTQFQEGGNGTLDNPYIISN